MPGNPEIALNFPPNCDYCVVRGRKICDSSLRQFNIASRPTTGSLLDSAFNKHNEINLERIRARNERNCPNINNINYEYRGKNLL